MKFLMRSQKLFQPKYKTLNTKYIADYNNSKSNLNIWKTLFSFQTRQLIYILSNKKFINNLMNKILRLFSKSTMSSN